MTLEELTELLATKDIHLIRVSDVGDGKGDGRTTMTFVGALEEYIHAIKTLESKVVFVNTIEVTEDYFVYSPYKRSTPASTWPFPHARADNAETEDDDDEKEYDLCTVKKGLEKFKSRIGEDGCFEFWICNLSYTICEKWMEELMVLRDEAIEKIMDKLDADEGERVAMRETLQEEEKRRLASMLKQLHNLISDNKFSNLKTQRAMRAYAIDKIPELTELDEARLKREIQDIAAKIEAGR